MGPPKFWGSFFKMLKIGYGEDFKMSERISTPAFIGQGGTPPLTPIFFAQNVPKYVSKTLQERN